MRKFILSLITFVVLVSAVFLLLMFAIPADKNAYLCEYEKKIEIIEKTPSPRLIFIGASQFAFDLDSKRISDSLGVNVVNMGLNAGIGAKYCLDDYLKYIRKGDFVVISPSYDCDYLTGGDGDKDVLVELMVCTHWRNFFKMNLSQVRNVMEGVPYFCYRNIKRWQEASEKGWDSPSENKKFIFVASGFNEYGDEVSHWTTPPTPSSFDNSTVKKQEVIPDKKFIKYLKSAIDEYEKKGAVVLLMPAISSESYFKRFNPSLISVALEDLGMKYITAPENLIFSDSLGYACIGDAHFNREGGILSSDKISRIIKEYLSKSSNSIF